MSKYIGSRYVPIFGRKGETSMVWDNTAPYEALTVVFYEGEGYTSKQYVPTGVQITNTSYWAKTYPSTVYVGEEEPEEGSLAKIWIDPHSDYVHLRIWNEETEEWTGINDLKGDTGATGPQGETGPQGPQGAQGPQGETGATGATGPQGPAGADGEDGEDGVDGTDGFNPTCAWSGDQLIVTDIEGPHISGHLTGPTGPAGSTSPAGVVQEITGWVKSDNSNVECELANGIRRYVVDGNGVWNGFVEYNVTLMIPRALASGVQIAYFPKYNNNEYVPQQFALCSNAAATNLAKVTAYSDDTANTIAFKFDTGAITTDNQWTGIPHHMTISFYSYDAS